MKAFANLYVAHLREFMRDGVGLFWIWAHLVFFAMIFPLLGHMTREPVKLVAVVADAKGPIARRLVDALKRLEVFECLEVSRADGEELWRRGSVVALISVTPGAEDALVAGRPATIEVLHDSVGRPSRALLPVLRSALRTIERSEDKGPARLTVAATNQAPDGAQPLDMFFPAAITLSLIQFGLFGTPMPLVFMRASGVLRRLRATPVSDPVILAAPIAVRLLVVTVQMVIVGLALRWVFASSVMGRFGVGPMLISVLGAATFAAVGLLIAGATRTPEAANVFATSLQVPMAVFSGVLIPIDVVPVFMRPVMSIWPSAHLWDALRHTMLSAPPIYGLRMNVLVLAAWLVAAGVLANRTFSFDVS